MFDSFKGAIFDLDGVIVDTAKYHYLAWKRLAEELGFHFTEDDNNRLKGVSRMKSLEILLEVGGIGVTDGDKRFLAEKKNNWYLEYIERLDHSEILPGAGEYILRLKEQGIGIALGSASKNAVKILQNLDLEEIFDVIIDGTKVKNAKPDPEVFLLGAEGLDLGPVDCIVFEDSAAGIEAAHNAGMKAVGIGEKSDLYDADLIITGLGELI